MWRPGPLILLSSQGWMSTFPAHSSVFPEPQRGDSKHKNGGEGLGYPACPVGTDQPGLTRSRGWGSGGMCELVRCLLTLSSSQLLIMATTENEQTTLGPCRRMPMDSPHPPDVHTPGPPNVHPVHTLDLQVPVPKMVTVLLCSRAPAPPVPPLLLPPASLSSTQTFVFSPPL